MKTFDPPSSSIHFIARALLTQGDNIVLCHTKGAPHHFLPGGHVENGESARDSLLRELVEEIGPGDYKIGEFMGVVENVFEYKEGVFQHEVNIVFNVEAPKDLVIQSKEDHIEFEVISRPDFANRKILPPGIKDCITQWIETRKVFFK